jgi:hypothetical protein
MTKPKSFFNLREPEELKDLRIRGFRPLWRTILRALMPTQSTSCFMASRSDTLRRMVEGRAGPVRWRVWNGVKAVWRMGVVYPLGMASVWVGQGGVMKFALGAR